MLASPALAQVAVDHVFVFARLAESAAERAQRQRLGHARGIGAQLDERRDLIARRLTCGIHGKQLPVLPREDAAQQLRRRTRDAALEQRALRSRIDNRGAELPQHADRALDEVDALLVGLREQRAIEILAHDADAQPGERRATWSQTDRTSAASGRC